MSDIEHRFTVRPLTEEEGGGWLVEYPDLPGGISDGESIEEAIANAEDVRRYWIAAMKEEGRPIPPPSVHTIEGYSGQWQLRAPKVPASPSCRARQAQRRRLKILALNLLAEGLGERAAHGD